MNRTNTAASAKARRPTDLKAIRRDVAHLDQRLRRMAREQPLLVLAMALAGGYLVGRVVSRF